MAIMMENLSAPITVAAYSRKDTDESRQNRVDKHALDQADLELFQRALAHHRDDDWLQLFARFQSLVLTWARTHPQHALASRYYEADYYVALAFERLWHATVRNRSLTFSNLEAALRYLKASLNGAILDTLRLYTRPEVPLPTSDQMHPEELACEDTMADQEIWEVMKQLFPAPREQRVAYLLFHCGLKPREIVRFCPDEFPQITEVYRLRRTLVERLLRNADWLRWRLYEENASVHRPAFSFVLPDRLEGDPQKGIRESSPRFHEA